MNRRQFVQNTRGFTIYGGKGVLSTPQSDPDYQILDLGGKVIKDVKGDVPANAATNAVSAGGEQLDG